MVAENPAPVICSKGMSINPHVTFADCPPLDFLLVPGGEGTQREVNNPSLIQFVAEQAKHCKAVLSVCTGTFILHRAGLLSNRRATTHWASLQKLRDLGDVEVVEDRIVRDGNIWTSAGISAGIDLALAFIEYMTDEKTAGKIQLGAEYYPSGRSYGMEVHFFVLFSSHVLDFGKSSLREKSFDRSFLNTELQWFSNLCQVVMDIPPYL